MLEYIDLQEGEIYYLDLNINENPIWIQKWKSSGIEIKKSKKYESEWNTFREGNFYNEIRLATEIEKAWLNHCIKEDKFVEYEEFIKVYKPQFIVGQWYRYNNHIGKFYSYDNDIFQVSEYIHNKKYYNSNSKWGGRDQDTTRSLATIEEIQEFLPLDHPDKQLDIKQIQEECKRRFPIGCKYKGAGSITIYTLNKEEDTYEILKENINAGFGQGYLYYEGKYAELIETSEEETIIEYVECIKGSNSDFYHTIGNICKVKSYNKKEKLLKLEGYRNTIRNIDLDKPFSGNNTDYKKSSKKAYDLQNSKQQPLTPEQCYNTEIEVGDEVENIDIQHYNGAVCTENNNYTEKCIKGVVTKKGYSVGADCIAYEITWHNGKKCGKSINQVKLIKKANKNTTTTNLNKKVDVSSPKVTDKITVPRINTTSYDTLVHINIETNTKSIKIPKLETNTPEIKKIKIQSLTLTI